VKELAPECARILVTGSPSLEIAVDAINRGAVTRMFIKPFQSIYLAMAIREAMEQVELALLARQLLARVRQSAMPAEDYEPLDARQILAELRREVSR
jgi:DNA-binding NtrC family response regulator